jgi:hypothetical protein
LSRHNFLAWTPFCLHRWTWWRIIAVREQIVASSFTC